MKHFDYHEPGSLDAVIMLLERYGSDAALLAGGTALLIDRRRGELDPGHIISLWGVPGLTRLDSNGVQTIGTLTTCTALAAMCAGQTAYQGLREAARLLGAKQVQNVATVGGNICKASPGADLVPPLLCLDASLRLAGPEGERTTPLDGFLIGPDQTALRPAEVLVDILVPQPPLRTATAFFKVMRRKAIDCSIVSVCARVTLAEDRQTFQEVRIGLAAVAPNPFRARRAEALLAGQSVDVDLVRQAARQARAESSPITDVRATAEYRSLLVETLVERAVVTAAKRARGAEFSEGVSR